MSKRITVTLDDDLNEYVEELVEDGEYDSKSKAVAEQVRRGRDTVPTLQERVDDLEEQLDRRDSRIDTLEQQLRERSQIEDKIEDLPDRIRGEESYQERRQRLLDRASPMQRFKWRITGVPVDKVDEIED
jgi:Arc/MetJ-type ribon-helix-helix transcriptional regulator